MDEVLRTSKGIDYIAKPLKAKKTVTTRAIFWKIPHASRDDDIRLKLGRYRRTESGEEVDVGSPKSELTLDDDEFQALVEFLSRHHAPLREGARKYLVLGMTWRMWRSSECALCSEIRTVGSWSSFC
jgi:hypothetical protein